MSRFDNADSLLEDIGSSQNYQSNADVEMAEDIEGEGHSPYSPGS
jgi:hypothetical protein